MTTNPTIDHMPPAITSKEEACKALQAFDDKVLNASVYGFAISVFRKMTKHFLPNPSPEQHRMVRHLSALEGIRPESKEEIKKVKEAAEALLLQPGGTDHVNYRNSQFSIRNPLISHEDLRSIVSQADTLLEEQNTHYSTIEELFKAFGWGHEQKETQQLNGRGGFGSIQIYSKEGKCFAVKEFHKDVVRREERLRRKGLKSYTDASKDVCRGEKLGLDLEHPNILAIKGFITRNPSGELRYTTQQAHLNRPNETIVSVVMDYDPKLKDLKRQIKNIFDGKEQDAKNSLVRNIVKQAAEGVKYLHQEHGIVHRDLKIENVLYNPETKEVKLIDYGVSRHLREKNGTRERAGSVCGTKLFMAPEQLLGYGHDTKVDVWSLGCLMLDLLGIESTPWSYYNEEYLLIDDLQNYRRQNTYMNKTFIEYFQDRLKHFRNTLGPQSPYTEDFKRYNGVIESLPQGLQDLLNEMFKANPEERCDINHVVTTLSSP